MGVLWRQALGFGATCVAAGIAIYVIGTRDFGISSDPGLHYAFAEELVRGYRWPVSGELPFPIDMADYPPGAHLLALAVGVLVDSTLRGIFIVTGLAFVVSYLALSGIARRRDIASTVAALAVFVLIAAATNKLRAYFGNEVISHFFFAQLVGTAAMLIAFLVVARIIRYRFLVWLLSSVVAAHLVAWFYPFSAIQFVFAATALQAIQIFDRPERWRVISAKSAVTAGALGLSLVVHPTFFGMVHNAAHDGGIVFPLFFIAALVACVAGGVVGLWWCRLLSATLQFDALSALAIGICAATLAQAVAYYGLSLGSPYAIKKHGFALGTVAAMVAASLIVELPAVRTALEKVGPRRVAAFKSFVAPAFLLFVLAAVFTGRPSFPVAGMIHYDKELRGFMSQADSAKFFGLTLSANAALPRQQNFTVAPARLRPVATVWTEQFQLFTRIFDMPKAAQFVIVARGSTAEPSCVAATSASFEIIDAKCFKP